MFRKAGYVMLLLAVLFLISGCGKKEEGRQLGIDGYVYMPEALTQSSANISRVKAYDGCLYYAELYNTGLRVIKGISTEGEQVSNITVYMPYGDLEDYCVDEEGAVYYFLQDSGWSPDYAALTLKGGCLVKMLPDGKVDYLVELPDTNILPDSDSSLATGQDGQVFLLGEDAIWLIDAGGKPAGKISTSEYKPESTWLREQVTEAADGRIYYIVEDRTNETVAFYEIVRDGSYQLKKEEQLSGTRLGTVYGSDCGLICDNNKGTLYRYDQEEAVWKELMYWGDSNLNSFPSAAAWITEDRLAAYFSMSEGVSRNESVLYLLRKTPLEELPEKEILVLAAAKWISLDLEYSILQFNRTSSRYHIIVELYETEDDIIGLDSSLVSSDPPDLLDLGRMNVSKYADKQVLEDLNPYLESSTVLKREDFLENALEGYTVDGKLLCIPGGFYIHGVTGRASQVGSGRGWTMEEVMELAEKYPEFKLVDHVNFGYILGYFSPYYIVDRFIDWESGKCSFDSEEFCSFVKWAEEQSKGRIELGYVEGEDYIYGAVPEDLLLIRATANSLTDWIRWEMEFGEKVSMMGYPTGDGSVLYPAEADNLIGIVSSSDQKEGAWEFLEQLLSTEKEGAAGGISVRRDSLMKQLEEEMTPQEREEGVILGKNSTEDPNLKPKGYLTVEGEQIPYYYMTKDQADAILYTIENTDFTPRREEEDEIMDIIMDELTAYLYKTRTLEEVVQIIQSRVQVIVQETM